MGAEINIENKHGSWPDRNPQQEEFTLRKGTYHKTEVGKHAVGGTAKCTALQS